MRDALRAPRLAHSARVATIAALLVALLYVGVTVPFDVLDARHLTRKSTLAWRTGSTM